MYSSKSGPAELAAAAQAAEPEAASLAEPPSLCPNQPPLPGRLQSQGPQLRLQHVSSRRPAGRGRAVQYSRRA
ncbi:hypothetical protein ACFX15_024567 [Malus domestica]